MLAVLATTVPFFALIACGYGAARAGLITEPAARGINAFVFWFALPALLFDALARRPFAEIVNLPFMAAYALAGLGVYAAAAWGAGRLFGMPLADRALHGQGATVSNIGFLALPLLIALKGDAVAVPIVLAMFVDLTLIMGLSVALIEAGRSGHTGPGAVLGRVGIGLVRSPIILSILAGAGVAAAQVPIPGPVDRFVGLLAAAAAPGALFALGASLVGRSIAGAKAEITWMVTAKLVVHPLAVAAALTVAGFVLPGAVPPLWVTTAILTAAMPVASNVFVLAQGYGLPDRTVSAAILASTVLAIASLTILIAWLG